MNLAGRRAVALGSSYGAGPGLRPRVAGSPIAAGRSQRNHAHLVAEHLGMGLADMTFSGATVAQPRHGGPGHRPAQRTAVTPDTALITITGGGNDVGYLPALTLHGGAAYHPTLASMRAVAAMVEEHLRA